MERSECFKAEPMQVNNTVCFANHSLQETCNNLLLYHYEVTKFRAKTCVTLCMMSSAKQDIE